MLRQVRREVRQRPLVRLGAGRRLRARLPRCRVLLSRVRLLLPLRLRQGGPFYSRPVWQSVYAISSDGRLHRLNVSTGDDVIQPVNVLPPNARVQSLTIAGNMIYTVTGQDCNGEPNAVWAIDLMLDPPKAVSYSLKGSDAWGLAGPTIGADGTVYVQTNDRLLVLGAEEISNSSSPCRRARREGRIPILTCRPLWQFPIRRAS